MALLGSQSRSLSDSWWGWVLGLGGGKEETSLNPVFFRGRRGFEEVLSFLKGYLKIHAALWGDVNVPSPWFNRC